MKTIITLGLLWVSTGIWAQVDETKMERDLKVAESALMSLLKPDNHPYMSQHSVSSNYIEDFGVIFNVPGSAMGSYILSSDESRTRLSYLSDGVVVTEVKSESETDSKDDESVKVQAERHKEELKEKIQSFLADYTMLLTELQEGEKVVVRVETFGGAKFVWGGDVKKSLMVKGNDFRYIITGEITKTDIDKLRTGNLKREQAMSNAIKISVSSLAEVPKDIEVLSHIFQTLYSSSNTETFWTSGNWQYDYSPEIGVIYHQRFYSSMPRTREGKKYHDLPTVGRSEVPQEERDEIVVNMYPDFVEGLKRNILDYARTLRSIGPDQMVMVKATLTECTGCNLPEKIEISVKGNILQDYNSGKITREKAVEFINFRELGNQ